ncbi:MAG TPA: hypothetical protein DD435_04200, partial [Cyanobacteria bacterium UBA8530]|nr:hypothetical protein [Cyanobacteria bacterium UBA8530]
MKANRKGTLRLLFRLFLGCFALLGSSQPLRAAEEKPDRPLFLNLLWTYHCPPSTKLPNGAYSQPWARLRAVRDCAGMADLVEDTPGLKVSFSLSPVFLDQLKNLNSGVTDRYFQLAEIPADRLLDKEKKEILAGFFSVPPVVQKRFPGYARLKATLSASYSSQDWRDLQTLFFLGWLNQEEFEESEGNDNSLEGIIKKNGDFSEEQKMMVLARHRQVLRSLLPRLKRLQAEGRLEIATTPYAHPILPLLLDSGLAKENQEKSSFSWPCDAKAQIDRGVAVYTSVFGVGPRGMWPPEGAVSPGMAPLVKGIGLRWMASGEKVFAASELSGHQLYRPWQVKGGPAVFFRNDRLSEEIRRVYPQMRGEEAAKNLLEQLDQVAREVDSDENHPIATLVLDGASTWDSYPDGGRAFLRSFYQGLVHDPRLKTILPSEYLSRFPIETLDRLASGWLGGVDFKEWVGRPSKDRSWNFLGIARQKVEEFSKKHPGDPRGEKALESLYLAEGSDWFSPSAWASWDGDAIFRGLLSSAYRQIGQRLPKEWGIPLRPPLARLDRQPKGNFTPYLDGRLNEWGRTGRILGERSAPIACLNYDWDKDNLYLALTFHERVAPYFLLHFGLPDREKGKMVPKVPFLCQYRAELSLGGGS